MPEYIVRIKRTEGSGRCAEYRQWAERACDAVEDALEAERDEHPDSLCRLWDVGRLVYDPSLFSSGTFMGGRVHGGGVRMGRVGVYI